MTRRSSRAAIAGAAIACLAATVGCQAAGPAGYATMRFAVDRHGADAGAPLGAGPAVPGALAAPAVAPLLVAATVQPTASAAGPRAGGSGGGGRPAPAPIAVRHPDAGPGAVTIAFQLGDLVAGAAQRRLLATVADIDYVVVTITPASGPEVSQTILASALSGGSGSVAFTGLAPGNAIAAIRAYDATGLEIGKGTQAVAVSATVPTTVNFSVTLNPTYVPPTGTVNANVTIVDGPLVVGTPPPGTVFAPGTKTAENTNGVRGPEGIAFDALGTAWFPGFTNDRVVALDRATLLKAGYPLKITGVTTPLLPTDIAFDPTGGMWVANYGAGSVSQVNPLTGAVIRTILTGPNPVDIEFVGATLHVLMYPLDTIRKFTTAGVAVGVPIPVNLPVPGSKFPFHMPVTLKAAPTGELWVANMKSDTVSKISAAGVFAGSFAVGDEPEGLAFGANNTVYVTNNRSGTVTKINATLNAIEATYPVGKRPRGIAVDKIGNFWIACSEDNQVVRMSPTGVILGRFNTAADPRHVAVDAGGAVWVACHAGNAVQKFAP